MGDCTRWFSLSAADEKHGLKEDCMNSEDSIDIFAALFDDGHQGKYLLYHK